MRTKAFSDSGGNATTYARVDMPGTIQKRSAFWGLVFFADNPVSESCFLMICNVHDLLPFRFILTSTRPAGRKRTDNGSEIKREHRSQVNGLAEGAPVVMVSRPGDKETEDGEGIDGRHYEIVFHSVLR